MFREETVWYDNVLKPQKSINKVSKVQAQVLNIVGICAWLEQQFKKAIKSHVKFYNKKHRPKLYNVKDKVFFNSKNIKLTRLSKKLDYKFYRLYKVENLLGKQAYYLKLPDSMKIHNIFYVLLL